MNENFVGRLEELKKLVKNLAELKVKFVAENRSQNVVIGFDSVG